MAYNNFDKMMDKKKKGKKEDMSDTEKSAKMGVLEDLKNQASEEMGKRLKGLKKVTVASDSKEGLQAGLNKAEDILENEVEGEEDLGDESESGPRDDANDKHMEAVEEGAGTAYGQDDLEGLSEEEVDAKLEKLMKMRDKFKNKA